MMALSKLKKGRDLQSCCHIGICNAFRALLFCIELVRNGVTGKFMQQSIKAWVYGKVQGVGFRMFCKRRAKELNLDGYALNLPDGRVEVLVSGNSDAIEKMIDALNEGPAFAQVLGVDVEPTAETVTSGFMTG